MDNKNKPNDFFTALLQKVKDKLSDVLVNLKRNKITYITALLMILLVVSLTFLLVVFIYTRDNNKTIIDYTSDDPSQTLPVGNSTDTEAIGEDDFILKETPDAGQEYLDKIIFVGESTTYHMKVHKVVNVNNVWAGETGTLALFNITNDLGKIYFPDNGKTLFIWEAAKIKQPEIIFLTFGLNGSPSFTQKSFENNYNYLIDKIKENSPNTKIILNTVYPITYEYDKANNGFTNEKIRQINEWIKEIAKNKKVYFINTYDVVSDQNGYLIDAYCNGDGYHLSKEGYYVLVDHIRRHAIKSYVK